MNIFSPTTDTAIAAIREMNDVVGDPIKTVIIGLDRMTDVISAYQSLPKRSGSIRFKGNFGGVLWKRSCLLACEGTGYSFMYRDANGRFYAEINKKAVKLDE